MMVVAIFVSLPFTTYALLSGLQDDPERGVRGSAGRRRDLRGGPTSRSRCRCCGRRSWSPTLINVINVFNSFPIIWEMTRGGPGYETATSTIYMFELKQAYVGESASMSVFNFVLVIVIVLVYLSTTRWKEQVDQ